MSESGQSYSVIKGGTVVLVLIGIAAWCSNPDEAHFKSWVARQVDRQAETPVEKIAGKVLPRVVLAIVDWERTNCGFFSVITIHGEQPCYFVGAFGNWWALGGGES